MKLIIVSTDAVSISPCLYNLVIADLDSMLNGNGGAEFGAKRISSFYYEGDIVLFTDSKQNLQDMLLQIYLPGNWGSNSMMIKSHKSSSLVKGGMKSNGS